MAVERVQISLGVIDDDEPPIAIHATREAHLSIRHGVDGCACRETIVLCRMVHVSLGPNVMPAGAQKTAHDASTTLSMEASGNWNDAFSSTANAVAEDTSAIGSLGHEPQVEDEVTNTRVSQMIP